MKGNYFFSEGHVLVGQIPQNGYGGGERDEERGRERVCE